MGSHELIRGYPYVTLDYFSFNQSFQSVLQ
jgi:hypothetical protein